MRPQSGGYCGHPFLRWRIAVSAAVAAAINCGRSVRKTGKEPDPKWCFLYDGDKLVQQPINFDHMTENLLVDWRRFFGKWQEDFANERPFFFYFSFPQVHTSLFAGQYFAGKSNRGLFGDNLNEMAWAVGKVLDDLKKNSLDTKTFVLFMSDHGPHVELCNAGGSAAGLKGGKSNSYEGGFRIPFGTWMPGTVKKGAVSHEIIWALDLFPTFKKLAYIDESEATVPVKSPLDGVDAWNELKGGRSAPVKSFEDIEEATTNKRVANRPIFYYCNKNLMAVRYGKYKVHYITMPIFQENRVFEESCPGGKPQEDWYVSQMCPEQDLYRHDPPKVYDVAADPYELYPLSPKQRPEKILAVIAELVTRHSKTIEPVTEQFGNYSEAIIPCCGEKCTCDRLSGSSREAERSIFAFFGDEKADENRTPKRGD
ncbi:CRE-SUL-2 protein [Aphelenchoides avenae]|nr:CRE-SUL-2 protein [Aphelenchus avenae]